MLTLRALHFKKREWQSILESENSDVLYGVASRCYDRIGVPYIVCLGEEILYYSHEELIEKSLVKIMSYDHREGLNLCRYCSKKLPDNSHGNRRYCNPDCEENASRKRTMLKIGKEY